MDDAPAARVSDRDRATVVAWANAECAERGVPPLQAWWENKTEPELHARARALGLLA